MVKKQRRGRNRRGPGEGTVYERSDGRWVAKPPSSATGVKSKPIYARTEAEAESLLTAAKQRLSQGLAALESDTLIPVFLTAWLEDAKRPSVRDSTYRAYFTATQHVARRLVKVKINTLATVQIRELMAELARVGMSASSRQLVHTVLKMALSYAVDEGLLNRNPMHRMKGPRPDFHERKPLSTETVNRVIHAAEGSRMAALWVLLAHTGLRISEALALEWADLDEASGIIRIRRQVTYIKGVGDVVGPPKSETGIRDMPVPPRVFDALAAHRVEQVKMRAKAKRWAEKNLIFTNSFGAYVERRWSNRELARVCELAGVEAFSTHIFRHTYATLLTQRGENPRTVQTLLGDKTMKVAMEIYTHIAPSTARDAALGVADLLGVPECDKLEVVR